MATQENLTISQQQFIAENEAVSVVSANEKKKRQEELAHLAAALQAVKEAVTDAKAGADGAAAATSGSKVVPFSASGSSDDVSKMSFEDAMTQFALLLGELQVTILKYNQNKTTMDTGITKDQVLLQGQNLQKLLHKIKKNAVKLAQQQTAQEVQKWLGIGISILMGLVGALTLQPELVIMAAVTASSASGLTSEVTQKLATALEDSGMSPEDAKIWAEVIVVVVVVAATLIAGAATATLEEGLVDNLVNRLIAALRVTIVAGAQTIASSGLVTDIADAIMKANGIPEDKRKQIEVYISLVVSIAAALASLGAGASSVGSVISKASTTVSMFTTRLLSFSRIAFLLGGLGQGAAGVTEGIFTLDQGTYQKELADVNAAMMLLKTDMEMNSEQTSQDQQHTASVIKGQKVGNESLSKLMAGEEGFAKVLDTKA